MLNKKDLSLDGIRGFAALIVFFAHFLAAFKPTAIFGSSQPTAVELFYKTPLGLTTAGNFAVCLFFILSGYVLSIKHFNCQTKDVEIYGDILKRYVRLGIPLVLTCLVSFLIYKQDFYYNRQVADFLAHDWFRDYFKNLQDKHFFSFFQDILFQVFVKAQDYNPPAWTIMTELMGSYLTFVVVVIARNVKANYRFILYLILFLLFSGNYLQNFILGIAIADSDINLKCCWKKLFSQHKFVFFMVANIGFYFSLLIGSFPYYLSKEMLISSGSFYQNLIILDNRDVFGGGITLISSALFFLTYKHTVYKHFFETNIMQILGKYSFMLYLTHFLTLASISSFVYLKIQGMGEWMRLLLTFIVYLLSTVLLTLSMEKYANLPSIQISNRFKAFYLNKTSQV
jgi:peptidoglycan/LPS O-acetylase OafA/YrhL